MGSKATAHRQLEPAAGMVPLSSAVILLVLAEFGSLDRIGEKRLVEETDRKDEQLQRILSSDPIRYQSALGLCEAPVSRRC